MTHYTQCQEEGGNSCYAYGCEADPVSELPDNLWETTLPTRLGLPNLTTVQIDNPHGSEWELVVSVDQGPYAHELDRYVAMYQAREGFRADYFHVRGLWSLGAN